MDKNLIAMLPDVLLPWYDVNKRNLPWRKDREPYHVWLSEIMLQQTRVEAVRGYYSRFLAAAPSVADLANMDDSVLEKLWEGLGYYSRVRNLKKAAIQIIEAYDGRFPNSYEQVIKLPGIGDYTAGAICSIAFNAPTPAVDGNVLRVISRVTNNATPIDNPAYKKQVREQLAEIYPDRAGDFTQALMELGATVCKPNGKPECQHCPCKEFCVAKQLGTELELPVRTLKKGRRVEELTVLILECDGDMALERRPHKGLLADMWQFPNVPGIHSAEVVLAHLEQSGIKTQDIMLQVERKHVFTHVEWRMRGVYVRVSDKNEHYTWLSMEQIKKEAALPTAFRMFLQELEKLND